jgi:hypothetical protein
MTAVANPRCRLCALSVQHSFNTTFNSFPEQLDGRQLMQRLTAFDSPSPTIAAHKTLYQIRKGYSPPGSPRPRRLRRPSPPQIENASRSVQGLASKLVSEAFSMLHSGDTQNPGAVVGIK